MQVADLITSNRITLNLVVRSKKRTLEHLSELLAQNTGNIPANKIFERLLGRERLGSTGLGEGIAIPHARCPGLTTTVGAFLRLEQAIDFDAIDDQPVDMLFALLVPEDAPDNHLQTLAQLAQMFSDPAFCLALRATKEPTQVYDLLQQGPDSAQAN